MAVIPIDDTTRGNLITVLHRRGIFCALYCISRGSHSSLSLRASKSFLLWVGGHQKIGDFGVRCISYQLSSFATLLHRDTMAFRMRYDFSSILLHIAPSPAPADPQHCFGVSWRHIWAQPSYPSFFLLFYTVCFYARKVGALWHLRRTPKISFNYHFSLFLFPE